MKPNPSSIWDYPVTDTELDAHYGREVTQSELSEVIGRHAAAFDADDLIDILHEHAEEIITAVSRGLNLDAGTIIAVARDEVIARRASIEIYGKPGFIKATDVLS